MSQQIGSQAANITSAEARDILTVAYIFGYPLVTMELTRRVMTNVVQPDGRHAPMGQFANMRTYPNASFRDVTAPNADTLYSSSWIDLSAEPYVFSIPDSDGRYFLMPLLDAWTNVFQVPGSRTTGTRQQRFAITGPNWKGRLADYMTHYRSPTNLVWILGRTYCIGTRDDYDKVHAFQDKLLMVPLNEYGKNYEPQAGKVDPRIDMNTPVRDQVHRMDPGSYFKLLSFLMRDNPPAEADAPLVAEMAKVGLIPGQEFDVSQLAADVRESLPQIVNESLHHIMSEMHNAAVSNGWLYSLKTGTYGTDYLQRAYVTAIGLGANRPQDAVYPTSEVDADGQPYTGAKRYVMHFDAGKMPPVNAFWSLTMYDEHYFFVPNQLDRANVSSRSRFKTNMDGSLDIYIQHESPGADLEPNWLPAPAGKFHLMLRMYWPKAMASEGRFVIPAVEIIH